MNSTSDSSEPADQQPDQAEHDPFARGPSPPSPGHAGRTRRDAPAARVDGRASQLLAAAAAASGGRGSGCTEAAPRGRCASTGPYICRMTSTEAPVGRLVVCPTPIGNLDDVTLRVLQALGRADVVACEDTRHTRVLLDRHGIRSAPRQPARAQRSAPAPPSSRERIRSGALVALVSDAGTPLVSDPGFVLVRACLQADLPVEVLPGPSAARHRARRLGAAGRALALRGLSAPQAGRARSRCSRAPPRRSSPSSRPAGSPRRSRRSPSSTPSARWPSAAS